jgi:alpha,alpha-trehalase
MLAGNNASAAGAAADINMLNGTVINGGNAINGEGWAQALQRELANRYMASAFCSWRATGGSIPGVVPRISDAELNVTGSIGNTGNVSCWFCDLGLSGIVLNVCFIDYV